MKVKLLLILFVMFSFRFGIRAQVVEMNMSNYKSVKFDSLVENISCVKLETENKSMFDYCKHVIYYKDNYYFMVYTMAGSHIIKYNNLGKFVKSITFSDALLVNTFTVVPNKEELWVISRFKILNKFKLDGVAMGRVSLPFPCMGLMAVNEQDFLVYDGGGRDGIEGHSMVLTDFKSIHKLFLPKDDKELSLFSPQNMFAPTMDAKGVYVLPDKCDMIYFYSLKQKDLRPCYHLDFNGELLIRKMYPSKGFSDREMHEIIVKRKYIYSYSGFYQASDKLFLKLLGKREDFCMINLHDHSLSSFNSLFDGFISVSNNSFVGSNGKNLYVVAKEGDLVKHYQKNKSTYSAIRKLLPSLRADGNGWILFIIEIRK